MIMHGGPFHDLMGRLKLGRQSLRAFVMAVVCWAIPAAIVLSTAGQETSGLFLKDWGTWAKFLVAPVLLTLAEKPIGFAVDECTSLIFRIPLVASQSTHEARNALGSARGRTADWRPEGACLIAATIASSINAASFLGSSAPGWATSGNGLSAAGLWCVAASNTIYWFMLARLLWKHLVWTGFLSDLAACDLRLAVTHPDGHGGLGFVGLYPSGGALFTLAISSVVAAGIGHVMQRETMTPTLFTVVCIGWMVIVLAYYALPLAGLSAKIARLKQRALMVAAAKAMDFERAIERELLGENVFRDEAEPEVPEFKDVKPLFLASMKTSALLLNKGNILPIVVPSVLPLLCVGASYLSWSQLGPIAKRLLFL
jgi:hypothetical protein